MANIFETARAERAYNKYVKGLESVAGLVETLSGPGPFTIFVPTDAAFDGLTDDQQANLFADPGKLAKVLKYHIVPGYYTADDLLDRASAAMDFVQHECERIFDCRQTRWRAAMPRRIWHSLFFERMGCVIGGDDLNAAIEQCLPQAAVVVRRFERRSRFAG